MPALAAPGRRYFCKARGQPITNEKYAIGGEKSREGAGRFEGRDRGDRIAELLFPVPNPQPLAPSAPSVVL